jgi:hypothetical protein
MRPIALPHARAGSWAVVLDIWFALSKLRPLPLLAALVVVIAASVHLWVVPSLQRQRVELAAHLAAAHSHPVGSPAAMMRGATQADRWVAFNDVLGDAGQSEELVGALFVQAKADGLTLTAGDYREGPERPAVGTQPASAATQAGKSTLDVRVLEATLPLTGSYAQVRRFSEQLLVAMPFCALDSVKIKRDTEGNGSVDAKLQFSFFLRSSPDGRSHVLSAASLPDAEGAPR